MTTFYEGDGTGLQDLGPVRYTPAVDGNGKWGVVDSKEPRHPFMVIRYENLESADAFADLLNAVDEGQPWTVIEDLRADLDRIRELARPS